MVFKGYISVEVGILKQLMMFETKFKLWHGAKAETEKYEGTVREVKIENKGTV